ncbi:MAG: hypothetical protein EPN85_04455, partial [Bacteroidetes bacterium]
MKIKVVKSKIRCSPRWEEILSKAERDCELLQETLADRNKQETNGTSRANKTFKGGSRSLTREEIVQLVASQKKYIKKLKNALDTAEQKAIIKEAKIELSKGQPNWNDRSLQLKIVVANSKFKLKASLNLIGYKNSSDFGGGLAPKGHEYRPIDYVSEKFVVNLKTGKRVESTERTNKLLENVGKLAHAARIDKAEIEIEDLVDTLVGKEIRLYNMEGGILSNQNIIRSDDHEGSESMDDRMNDSPFVFDEGGNAYEKEAETIDEILENDRVQEEMQAAMVADSDGEDDTPSRIFDFPYFNFMYNCESYEIKILDEHGNVIENKIYNSLGYFEARTTCKYNEHGNVIETQAYNSVGDLVEEYKYDNNGNVKTIDR